MISNKWLMYLSTISFFLITTHIHASEKPEKKRRNPYYSPYYARECYVQVAIGTLLNLCGISLMKEKTYPDKIMRRSAIATGLTLYILTYRKYRHNKEYMKPYLTK